MLEVAMITTLRIGVLAPISPEDKLTPTEQNDGIGGPIKSSLIKSWREAFRTMPERHLIDHVQFNMSCQQKLEPRQLIRLLQEVSTLLYVKAMKNTGKELSFEVMGCEDVKKKAWLEASFPGKKEG
jgi:hypothetical protein